VIAVPLTLAIGAAFIGVGRWGRRSAADLVPPSYSEHGRAAKERSLRRGATTCLLAGGLFCVFALVEAVDLVVGER
jgi:hypothetical protein